MRSLVVFVVAIASVCAAPKSLPSNWPTCRKNDPKLSECIRDGVHAAVRDLSDKGAKEFGVFPIDPLVISKITIGQGSGPVSIDLDFTDLNITGLRNARLGPVDSDIDNYNFKAPVFIKTGIVLKGQYKINGKVLVLPITGQGACELILDDFTGTVELQGREHKKDNVKYMDVTDFKFNFDTTRMKIRLENLFNGNKALSDQMNVFLNENWPEILKELKPAIAQAFGAAFGDISNRIFRKVPYNKIFP